MKRTWLFIPILLMGASIWIGYSIIFNSEKENISIEKAEFQLYANNLIYEFEQNEVIANKKYISKIVEVKGKIGEIIKNNGLSPVVILKEEDDMFGINCMVSDKNLIINNYIVGDSIAIRGILQGYLNDVIINNCIITK